MEKEGMGVGSVSVILIFSILCLTIFSLITLSISRNNSALADARADLVVSYYEADAKSELIVAHIKESIETDGKFPTKVGDTTIELNFDDDLGIETAVFIYPISDEKELYVRVAMDGNKLRVLNWQMLNIGEWEFDGSLGVWLDW